MCWCKVVALSKTLLSALKNYRRWYLSSMSTFCTDIIHFLWSNMQPQFPDHRKKHEILNAHIVRWGDSSGGWYAFCTWFIISNSGHALDIWSQWLLRVSHTHPSHFRLSTGSWFGWKQFSVGLQRLFSLLINLLIIFFRDSVTVIKDVRKQKIYTFQKLKSDTLDIFSYIVTQNDLSISKIVGEQLNSWQMMN